MGSRPEGGSLGCLKIEGLVEIPASTSPLSPALVSSKALSCARRSLDVVVTVTEAIFPWEKRKLVCGRRKAWH